MDVIAKRIIIEKLRELSHEDFKKSIEMASPRLSDLAMVKDVIAYCASNGIPVSQENNPLIMTVIYYLFAEYKIYYHEIKLPIGTRGGQSVPLLGLKPMKWSIITANYVLFMLKTGTGGKSILGWQMDF